MELLPEDLRVRIPPLLSQDKVNFDDKIVYAKYIIPGVKYIWFVVEGEQQNNNYLFFGYVINEEGEEWTNFPLRDMEEVNKTAEELKDIYDMTGLSVERVSDFEPTEFRNAIAQIRTA